MECIVPDCTGQSKYKPESTYKYAKYCEKHRARMRRHGDPAVALIDHTPADERWKKLYRVDAKTDCWMWAGVIDKRSGYGVISDGATKQHMAHRFVYQQVVGEIPEDRELDHLCRRPSCVNPKHMGVVTHTINVQRGDAGIKNAAKTHCVNGHEFTPENTYIVKGRWRSCRECTRIKVREHMREKRARARLVLMSATHCKRGHEFTPENEYAGPWMSRQCRECARDGGRTGKPTS